MGIFNMIYWIFSRLSLFIMFINDTLGILPRYPLVYYFSMSQRLLKVAARNKDIDASLLDHLLTRFEMGHPVMELSKIVSNWDWKKLSVNSERALMVVSAYILSRTLDKELCLVWIFIFFTWFAF